MGMIDFTVARRLFENYLKLNFTTVPIQNENTRIESGTEAYIALTDVGGESQSMGMGTDIFRVDGGFVIQIYTPLGSGTEQSRELASELAELLVNANLSGFTFTTPQLDTFGQVEEADYYQQNLTVPYVFFYGQDEDLNC